LHRLPLGRFADHSPSSSRRSETPAVLTTSVVFDVSSAVYLPSPSQLLPASFNADFSAVAHDRSLLNFSRTAWFDACLCRPTSRGLPSSPSVAPKNPSSVLRSRRTFGAQSSRPAFSLHTLRRLPVARQTAMLVSRLPATALARRDLHPLGLNRKFHCLVHSSPLSALLPARSPNLLPGRVVASSQTLLARDPDPGGVSQGGATAIGSGHTLSQLIAPSLQ
jgi:hypothetical protein